MRLTALLTFVCLTCSLGVQSALADDPHGYLALGDSLAFGFNPLVSPPNLSDYHGYPEFIAQALSLDHKLANASCFGETSSHFIKRSLLPDLGCEAWRNSNLPMFVSYSASQLDYAVQYLRDHPKAQLVTIDIGINDLVVLALSCGITPTSPPTAAEIACATTGLTTIVIPTYVANLEAIYSGIRATQYQGPIVAVTGYSPNYADPIQTPAIATLNYFLSIETLKFGGKIADAFTAFAVAAGPSGNVCQTGLLIKLPDGTCDTHPSAAGQALIAKLVLGQIASEDGKSDQEKFNKP